MTTICNTPQEFNDKIADSDVELTVTTRTEQVIEAKDKDGNIVLLYKKVIFRK